MLDTGGCCKGSKTRKKVGETSKGCRGCIVHIYVSLDDSKAIVGENVKCLLKVRGNITQWRASLKHKKTKKNILIL